MHRRAPITLILLLLLLPASSWPALSQAQAPSLDQARQQLERIGAQLDAG